MSKTIKNVYGGGKHDPEEFKREKLLEMAAVAAQQLQDKELDSRFVPEVKGSKPTAAQQQFIDDFVNRKFLHAYVRGGNQCLLNTTLVATPSGPKRIDALQAGDYVLDPDNKPIMVMAIHDNGMKEVFDYTLRNKTLVTCTDTHKFLTYFNSKKGIRRDRKSIKEVGDGATILHNRDLYTWGGYSDPDLMWLLGFLQGDGCCTCGSKNHVYFSCAEDVLVDRVRITTDTLVSKCGGDNYNWNIHIDAFTIPHYNALFCGKKAHEKYIPIEILQEYDSDSCLAYLAGLLDSDGSFTFNAQAKTMYMEWLTQCPQAAETITWLFRKLFRIELNLSMDDRDYKNGSLYCLRVQAPHDLKTVAEALKPYVTCVRKLGIEVNYGGARSYPDCTTVKKDSASGRMEHVFNITVDHPENLYQLANGLISKNSGKSITCCYLCGKLLMGNLPNWKRLPQWGSEPLLILLLSQNSKQIEDSLWRKMRTYLKAGTYREFRSGGALQRVVMNNGNTLVLFTYHNLNDARAAVQSFTGHYVFIDELPSKAALIEEAQTRVIKNLGQFVCAFTPKVPAPEVKRLVETADPSITGFYRLKFDDNPAMDDQARDAQHKKAAQWGEKGSKMILEGDWVGDELNIFRVDEAECCRSLPPHIQRYSSQTYVGLDPANSSGFGLVVLLYDSKEDCYYIDLAKTLTGPAISSNSRAAKAVQGYLMPYGNVSKIVCDPASSGFRGEARDLFRWSFSIPNKNDDAYFWKSIEIVQEMLGVRLFFTENARDLLDELAAYSRDENNPERVINRKRYHLVDALRYLCSLLPKRKKEIQTAAELPPAADGREVMARYYDEKRKEGSTTKVLQKIRVMNKGFRGY